VRWYREKGEKKEEEKSKERREREEGWSELEMGEGNTGAAIC
jgi:hypothetical protein